MYIRVGKVTNVYPEKAKVKVYYEDLDNTTLPLPVITMNKEYSMPEVGDMVLVLHMENGSSKGFVLGTYYSEKNKPKAKSGYRKDIGDKDHTAYVLRQGGKTTVYSDEIVFSCAAGSISLSSLLSYINQFVAHMNSGS